MTYENALYRFIDFAHNQDVTTDIHEEMIATIKEALEKQILKEPNESMVSEYCVDWVCPCCERFHRTEWKMHYCSNCGQAIEWSDEE